MSPATMWLIIKDEDLVSLSTNSVTAALNQLSPNTAAEALLSKCPPPNPNPVPDVSQGPQNYSPAQWEQPDAAWSAPNSQVPPWDMQSLMTDATHLARVLAQTVQVDGLPTGWESEVYDLNILVQESRHMLIL